MKDFSPQRVESFQIRSTGDPSQLTPQISDSYESAIGRQAIDGLKVIEVTLVKEGPKTESEAYRDEKLEVLADIHAQDILLGSDTFRRSAQVGFGKLSLDRPDLAERIETRIDTVRRRLLAEHAQQQTPPASKRRKSKG